MISVHHLGITITLKKNLNKSENRMEELGIKKLNAGSRRSLRCGIDMAGRMTQRMGKFLINANEISEATSSENVRMNKLQKPWMGTTAGITITDFTEGVGQRFVFAVLADDLNEPFIDHVSDELDEEKRENMRSQKTWWQSSLEHPAWCQEEVSIAYVEEPVCQGGSGIYPIYEEDSVQMDPEHDWYMTDFNVAKQSDIMDLLNGIGTPSYIDENSFLGSANRFMQDAGESFNTSESFKKGESFNTSESFNLGESFDIDERFNISCWRWFSY